MQNKITAREAIAYLGLPEGYVLTTPADFWTPEAFALFQAASRAGIIAFDDLADRWSRGLGRPLQELKELRNTDTYNPAYERPIIHGQLAYFCQRASKRLHLNNGAHTNWGPFEKMFGYKPKALRGYLHNRVERSPQGRLEDRLIDTFFDEYRP